MGLGDKIKSAFFGTPVDYSELLKNGAVVIDVRTPQEFGGGNVKGSKNIPLPQVSVKACEQFKGKTVILVCRSGGRAQNALSVFKRAGIDVYNAGAWNNLVGI
jgi:rhodanese-related sulfurtransferase